MNQGVSKTNIKKLQEFLIKKQNEVHNSKSNNKPAPISTGKPRTT
jgi:hypothetical protein